MRLRVTFYGDTRCEFVSPLTIVPANRDVRRGEPWYPAYFGGELPTFPVEPIPKADAALRTDRPDSPQRCVE